MKMIQNEKLPLSFLHIFFSDKMENDKMFTVHIFRHQFDNKKVYSLVLVFSNQFYQKNVYPSIYKVFLT